MRGTILQFDEKTHRGSIAGYDGQTYDFVMLDWHSAIPPANGALVEFSMDGSRATAIDLVSYAHSPKERWLKFLFSAVGRTSRREYWIRYVLPFIATMLVASVIDGLLFIETADGRPQPSVFRTFAYLFFLVPMFAVPAKRLHDLGYSGWWASFSSLLGPTIVLGVAAYWYYSTQMRATDNLAAPAEPLSPVVAALLIIAVAGVAFWWLHLSISVMFFRGQSGENRYGPDPLPPLEAPAPANRGRIISMSLSGLIVIVGFLASLISVLREAPSLSQAAQSEVSPLQMPPAAEVNDPEIKQKTDVGLSQMMDLPLIGLLAREVPDAKHQIEMAVSEYAQAQDKAAADAALERARRTIASLRSTHVSPALRRAPDIDIVRIWQAQGALVEYLLQNNARACREYAEVGIRDVAALDQNGRDLFTQSLKATEVAFMSGRISHIEYPLYGAEEAATLLLTVGFTDTDFDVFVEGARHTDREVCETTSKMYGGVLELPDDTAAQLMRTILVDQ